MKIRIKENSVRLRLTKIEVKSFLDFKEFSQTTHFGNTIFQYSLKVSHDCDGLNATFTDNEICVYISPEWAEKWKADNEVGFSKTIQIGGHILTLKVEKDFVCLDETDEDQSDNYPNPRLIN